MCYGGDETGWVGMGEGEAWMGGRQERAPPWRRAPLGVFQVNVLVVVAPMLVVRARGMDGL